MKIFTGYCTTENCMLEIPEGGCGGDLTVDVEDYGHSKEYAHKRHFELDRPGQHIHHGKIRYLRHQRYTKGF